MSIWSKTITSKAAFWGIVLGFFGNVIPSALQYVGIIDLPSYFNPALIGTALSLMAIIGLSVKGTVSSEEREYRENLHRTPEIDCDLQKTRITLWAPGFLIVYGCLMPLLLIKYYVIPYQTGDVSVDLASGEAIMTMLTAPLYIIMGLIVAKVVRRRYSPIV